MHESKPLLSLRAVLPEELIIEILVKLSVRSLLRFKCVSKLWKTLISSPQFVKDHLHNSISDTTMTRQRLVSFTDIEHCKLAICSVQSWFENPSSPPETRIFRLTTQPKYKLIAGSCNGLLCSCDYWGYFRLWNFSTRLISERSRPAHWFFFTHYGFGYDQVNDKYKVIIFDNKCNMTQVHTFGTNSWKMIQNPPCIFYRRRDAGKFVSGTLNWLGKKGDVVISFDMEREIFSEMLLPTQLDGDLLSNHVLDVVSNYLCLCYTNEIHCVAWLMKKYGIQESWTKLMWISRWRLKIPKPVRHIHPLCISENGVVLAKSTNGLQLVLYNPNSDTLDYPKTKVRFRHDMHIYHESLVSPL